MSRYIPDDLRESIIARDRSVCAYCGRRCGSPGRRELELDHVIPYASNGAGTEGNLVVSCLPCNRKKGSKQGWRWTPKPVFMWVMLRNLMYLAALFAFCLSTVLFLQDNLQGFIIGASAGMALVSIGWLRL